MTPQDTMRLALEALEIVKLHFTQNRHVNEAIEALRSALAQQGEQPVACKRCNGSGWVVRDPDIGTDQECFVCDGTGVIDCRPLQVSQQGEQVELYGVKNGVQVHLGKTDMPPRMKARKIAREQFGHFEDDDGSDAELCFGALEQMIDWMFKQGFKLSAAQTAQPDTWTDDGGWTFP